MPACGRRRPQHAGPWVPSSDDDPNGGRGGPPPRGYGPTNLDLETKASLQKLLKPSNYGAIDTWMRSHGIKDKKAINALAEAALGDNGVPVQKTENFYRAARQDLEYSAARQPVQLNKQGRQRVQTAIHVTPDRQQADLMKVKCGEDQRDPDLIRRRKFLNDFVPVHSTESMSDYYRLSDVPVSAEPGSKVLTEDARRGLTRWQIRGPEQNRETTAQVCQALRSLGDAVQAVPTYTDRLRERRSGSQGCIPCLIDNAAVKQAHRSGQYMRTLPMDYGSGAALSRSMPTIPPAYLSEEEISNIKRPGGYVVNMNDCEPLQRNKNKQRNITTKIVSGGATSYTTSYNTMAESGLTAKQTYGV